VPDAIRTTASYVVMERSTAHRLGRRLRSLERLIADVREAHENDRTLLNMALAELAHARGSKDAASFAYHWLRAHRRADNGGIPIRRKSLSRAPD